MEPLRVLVIDDEASIRDAIGQVLTMEGHVVETAGDGKTAQALLGNNYHAAFIDYKLPDTDGLNLLSLLREKNTQTATCMITAYANFETAVAATRQGADVFLPKPFSTEELLATLETLASCNRLRQETDYLKQANETNLRVLAQERSRTRTIIECLHDGVLVINREGLVVYSNRQTLEFLRFQENQVMEHKVEEVFQEEPFEEVVRVLKAGPPEARRVFEADSGEKAFSVEVSSYLDPQGEPLGTVVVLRDITQEKKSRQVKAAFMRMMIHELRSPVSTLMSFLAILRERLLGEGISAYQDAINRMNNRVNTLAQLISDLLDVMRIDVVDTATLKRKRINLAEAVQEQIQNFNVQVEERKLQTRLDIPAELSVMADHDDVQRILSNLISNAIKYNREGGQLTLRAKAVNDLVELDVADTGCGIRPENQPRIFSEFFREKKTETQHIVGSGLGLSIVQRLCQRNAGRVRFVSEPGVGSTFTISLPLSPDRAEQIN